MDEGNDDVREIIREVWRKARTFRWEGDCLSVPHLPKRFADMDGFDSKTPVDVVRFTRVPRYRDGYFVGCRVHGHLRGEIVLVE